MDDITREIRELKPYVFKWGWEIAKAVAIAVFVTVSMLVGGMNVDWSTLTWTDFVNILAIVVPAGANVALAAAWNTILRRILPTIFPALLKGFAKGGDFPRAPPPGG